MRTVTWLLAWRYLLQSAYEKSSSIMVKVCFLSIFIGSFALGLVMAVMQGFEVVTHEKMQGIHAQAIIQAHNDESLDLNALNKLLNEEFPDVIGATPSSTEHAIIVNPNYDTMPTMIMLKGINPVQESKVTSLEHALLNKTVLLHQLLQENGLIIGINLAENLNIKPGDRVELYFTDEINPQKKSIKLNKTKAMISGIFKTGIEEFDAGFAFCNLNFLHSLFPNIGINQLHLKFNPDAMESDLIAALQKRLNISVYSWKDMYPALVSGLRLEKYVMFIILVLIMIVASMNMISLLFMQIIYKRPDIAILQAMGCPIKQIQKIFFLIGSLIAGCATFVGLVTAYIVSILLETYPFIRLPDVYYVSYLPAKTNLVLLCIIFLVIMIINSCALFIPLAKTRSIRIADILRHEG